MSIGAGLLMATNIGVTVRLARISSYCFRNACTYKHVTVEDRGPIRIVSINRPESRNCVNSATAEELYDAFKNFDNESSVSVGILAGNGGTFCAGYDLKELSGMEKKDISFKPFMPNSKGPMGPSRLLISKPVIACLTGYAVAGGLELALWCDLRVAEKSAKFGIFCRRYGVPLIDGGTVRLPMMIGLSRALDLILSGREVSAKEGLEIGLVNRVVSDGEGLQEAIKLANQIAAFPQICLRKDRFSAIISNRYMLEECLRYEFEEGTNEEVLNEAIANAKTFGSQKK